MLRVAIACENSDTDGAIWVELLKRLFAIPVEQWSLGYAAFSGFAMVYRLAPIFLEEAAQAGVEHALLIVDNDGGAKLHPEHSASCDPIPFGTDPTELVRSEGCRFCTLSAVVPETWRGSTYRSCVVVPVQTIETWIMCAQGQTFRTATPEKQYDRKQLKRLCYGKGHVNAATRVETARRAFTEQGALDRLRERPSFQRFELCVSSWRSKGGLARLMKGG